MKNNYLLPLTFIFFMALIFREYFLQNLLIFWVIILAVNYQKLKGHFILLLLVLEILSLNILIITSLYVYFNGASLLIFLLITLSVGEAVLGLAILVKLIR